MFSETNPDFNFLQSQLYLIDFGFSKKYISRDGIHKK